MKRNYITTAVLVVAVLFIMVGLVQGQPSSVLAKAVRICLECVGIG